jgi:hypothetical protein
MSKQGSISLSYNKDGWLVDVGAYIKKVNGITTQSQGFLNQYEFVKEHGSYSVNGLDLLVRKNINNTNVWLSYSYMDNIYTFDSLPENEFLSNFDITHTITFGSAITINKLNIAAGFNWHSGKPISTPVMGNEIIGGSINYNPTNSVRLEDYFRIDLSATYKYEVNENVNIKSGISVWNLLDQENVIDRYYKINNEGNTNEMEVQSLGFTPNAILKIQF